MTAAVLQALIAAGVPAPEASRLSLALDAAYGVPASSSSQTSYSGKPSQSAFALYASSPGVTLTNGGPGWTGGRAALGVDGLAHISGQLYASSTAYVGELSVSGAAAVSMSMSARTGTFSDGVHVPGSASITSASAALSVPLVSNAGLISRGGAQFSGDNAFLGPVTLAGPVNWDGEKRPATVDVLSIAGASGNVVRVGRQQVAVLHDYGDLAPGALTFSLGLTQYSNVLRSPNASTVQLVATSVITKVGFDPTACAVTSTGTTVYHAGAPGQVMTKIAFEEISISSATTGSVSIAVS